MGILLIYDVTNTKTWSNIRNWVRNIEANAPQTVNKILIGNKCDMTAMRQVTAQQGEQLAREYDMKFFETSVRPRPAPTRPAALAPSAEARRLLSRVRSRPQARSGQNVSEAFLTLATDVKDRLLKGGDGGQQPTGGVNLSQTQPAAANRRGCC